MGEPTFIAVDEQQQTRLSLAAVQPNFKVRKEKAVFNTAAFKQSSCTRYDLAPRHRCSAASREQTSKFSDCFLLHVGGRNFPRQCAQSSRCAHVALEAKEMAAGGLGSGCSRHI